jgi:hypothetical protein
MVFGCNMLNAAAIIDVTASSISSTVQIAIYIYINAKYCKLEFLQHVSVTHVVHVASKVSNIGDRGSPWRSHL